MAVALTAPLPTGQFRSNLVFRSSGGSPKMQSQTKMQSRLTVFASAKISILDFGICRAEEERPIPASLPRGEEGGETVKRKILSRYATHLFKGG